MLQAAGLRVSRFVGSRGPFDLIAVGPGEIRLIQVKVGHPNYLSRAEREAIVALQLPAGTSAEFWRLLTLDSPPIIEAPIRPPGPRRQRSGVFAKPCTAAGCIGVIVESIASHLARRKYCTRTCANRATVAARFAMRRRKARP